MNEELFKDYKYVAEAFCELLVKASGEGIFQWSEERMKSVAEVIDRLGERVAAKNLRMAFSMFRKAK